MVKLGGMATMREVGVVPKNDSLLASTATWALQPLPLPLL